MYQLSPTDTSNRRIGDLPQALRPREKLQRLGDPSVLTEWELLCLHLGKGGPGAPVEEVAERLESLLFSPLSSDTTPSLKDLIQVKGLGMAKACSILAGLELGRRTVIPRGRAIAEPRDALPHLLWMVQEKREHFHALYVDTRRQLIAEETISVGTLDSSLVHPREVFRPAFLHSASAVLVAHLS